MSKKDKVLVTAFWVATIASCGLLLVVICAILSVDTLLNCK